MGVSIKNLGDCVACGACAEACPQEVLKVEDNVEIANADDCISCGLCADACPVDVLEVD